MSSSPRLLSLLAALALFAAACGGGDTDAATESSAGAADSSGSATDEAGDTDAAGSNDAGGDAETEPDAEATTESDAGSDADAASWPHTFVADQIGGGQLDANDLAGQDLVLWFWAPW